jgi:hypothetical protein
MALALAVALALALALAFVQLENVVSQLTGRLDRRSIGELEMDASIDTRLACLLLFTGGYGREVISADDVR